MSKKKPNLKRLDLTTINTEEGEETGLSEHEIKKNILSVYQDLKEVDIKEQEDIVSSDSFTKLYSIIDHNQTGINTIENIKKIIEVYEKEVYIQNEYISAIKKLELENQLYIPEIIDHGILFVEKEEDVEKEMPNDIEFVKSFGKIQMSLQRQPRPVGIGNTKNPLLKRYFFINNGKQDNGKEDNINNIIFEDSESYGLFYFIQMEKVHDELPEDYKHWNEFEWDNKRTCINQLNEYRGIHDKIIDETADINDEGNILDEGYIHNDVNSSNIFVKKESDETYKYALIDFGEASKGLVEKYTFNCEHINPDIDSITELVDKFELGGKKKTKKKRIINKKRKTYKPKKTKTNKNINKKNRTKKQFLYNPDDPKKSFDVYIDKDPTDTIPIKYTTVDDVKITIKTLEKLYKQNKYPHKRIWQVGMIMKVRLEAMLKHKDKLYPNAKNVKSRFDLANKYFLFLRSRTKEKDEKKRKGMKFNH